MAPIKARVMLFLPLAAFLLGWGSPPAAPPSGGASPAPSFGTAANFAVLAGTAVTCTNATVTGNVGVSPGTAITQTSCPVTGTINAGNSVAAQAHTDFLLAYDRFKALACDRTLTTLDGLRLSPGVYCVDAAATSTGGVLTLDGASNGTWIFKIGTLGTGALTGTNFKVVTPSGALPACNGVYWWVAEAATLTDSTFVGTILAGAAITLTRGTFNGDAFAKAGATITGTAVTACALGGASPPPSTCKDKCRHEDKDKKHGHDDCDDDDDHGRGGDDHDGKHKEYRR
jgi:ice-binding like protein